jgi:alpha-L-rhamnosidase
VIDPPAGPRIRPTHLRVEHLSAALGIDTNRPRFSWWLPDGARTQLAYRMRADNGWDTGQVESTDSILVEYAGAPLRSAERVTWRVKVWTDAGKSEWSDPHVFEMGLLGPDDWSAHWITPREAELPSAGRRPAMLVRGEFELPGAATVRARLYATAHGIYEVFVNGRRAGDAELTPGYTEYRDRLQVQTCDVTDLLRPGRNAIGAILSDGWFRGQVGLPRAHDQWGSELAWLAQLQLQFADGTTIVVGLMSRVAEAIGRHDDATRYRDLARAVRAAWQAEFVGEDGRLCPDTQANHVRALAFDLVPDELRPPRSRA